MVSTSRRLIHTPDEEAPSDFRGHDSLFLRARLAARLTSLLVSSR